MKTSHKSFYEQHFENQPDAFKYAEYKLGSTADGLCCRGPFAGKRKLNEEQLEACSGVALLPLTVITSL